MISSQAFEETTKRQRRDHEGRQQGEGEQIG